jgi:DHA2 family multidrug resistance protein-like MFS transporter
MSDAGDAAQHYPPSVQDQIIAGAKSAFLQGDQWAYLAGIIAVLVGAVVVFLCFPRKAREQELLTQYQATAAAPPGSDVTPAADRSSAERSRRAGAARARSSR